jgi:hypothetical protein
MAGFLPDFFWKASHYKGLGKFKKDKFMVLDDEFKPPKLADMIRGGTDPVKEALRRVISLSEAEKRYNPNSLLEHWLRVETPLNARLCLASVLAGPEKCAAFFAPSLDRPRLHAVRINGCVDTGGTKDKFGQPDLLLVGDKELVMVEMKVRGNKSDQKYSETQLLKYLTLANYAFDYLGLYEVFHLILVPAGGPTPFKHKDRWIQSIEETTGSIQFRLDGLEKAAEGTKWKELLEASSGSSKLEHLISKVPVRRVFYSDLRPPQPNPSDPWITEARQQLERLARHAEPSNSTEVDAAQVS